MRRRKGQMPIARDLMLILVMLLSLMSPSIQATVALSGKVSSTVTGFVVKPNNLFVTDDKGGWYDQGLVMERREAMDSPYDVQVPLRITSSSGKFTVRMAAPLVLQHQSQPAMQFRNITVTMNKPGYKPNTLSTTKKIRFTNPVAPVEGEDTVGHYQLSISALPPEGSFKTITGTYSGVLSLTFEPVVEV